MNNFNMGLLYVFNNLRFLTLFIYRNLLIKYSKIFIWIFNSFIKRLEKRFFANVFLANDFLQG